VATPDDNPTIGLVLCSEKNDAVVRYVLADKSEQIFASRYQFALPSEADLRAEIRRELEQFERDVPARVAKVATEKTATGKPNLQVETPVKSRSKSTAAKGAKK
jgi:hypothetical protein